MLSDKSDMTESSRAKCQKTLVGLNSEVPENSCVL